MIIESNSSTTVTLAGKKYLYFGGTNYLGLAHRPELLRAASAAFHNYGFSAGASRLTSGENTLILALESELANFGRSAEALVVPSGFMANTAVVDGIDELVDAYVVQKQAHGSITAAVSKSRKPVIQDDFDFGPYTDANSSDRSSDRSYDRSYDNSSGNNSARSFNNSSDRRSFRERHGLSAHTRLCIFAEPIDVMSGKLLNVPALLDAANSNDFIVLDEAHSFGVLGENGVGAKQHFKIDRPDTLIRTGTFSKAMGCYGGFILGNKSIIDAVKLHSSSYKSSTPLSPVLCAAARESLLLIVEDAENTIQALQLNIASFNRKLTEAGVGEFLGNSVPIYHLRNSPAVAKLREVLPQQGIYVPTVTSYFADFCEIGLRWTIQAGHAEEDFERLIAVITEPYSRRP